MYNKKINEIIEEYRNKLENKNYSKINNIGILITELESNGFMVENPYEIPHLKDNETKIYNIKIQDKESSIRVNMYKSDSGLYEINLYDTAPEESVRVEALRNKKREMVKDIFQETIKNISRENVDNYFSKLEELNEDNVINIVYLTQNSHQRKKPEIDVLKEYGRDLALAAKGEKIDNFDFFYTLTLSAENYLNSPKRKNKNKP